MTTSLTKEQQGLLPAMSERWLLNAFSGKNYNRALIENSLERLYGIYGLKLPEIIYVDSPAECQRVALELKSRALDKNVQWRNIYGNELQYELERQLTSRSKKIGNDTKKYVWEKIGASSQVKLQIELDLKERMGKDFESFSPDGIRAIRWCCYYDFFRKTGAIRCKGFDRYRDYVFNSGIFMSIYSAAVAILCPHPSFANFNDKGQLHCSDGPAFSWRDNYKLYYLNGIQTSEVFFLPADELDPLLLLKEKNAEARKEIIRKIGINRVIEGLGAVVIDCWRNYELLTLDIPGMTIKPTYLKMLNPSTGAWHIEGVPPTINTCQDALAWRDGETVYSIPEIIT